MPAIKHIAILSTFDENVGDDLIRYGTEHLLDSCNIPYARRFLAKSNPASLYTDLLSTLTDSSRFYRFLSRNVSRICQMTSRNTKIAQADVFLVAGTPLFYYVPVREISFRNEWWVRDILDKNLAHSRSPLCVGIGLGSILRRNLPIEKQLGEEEWNVLARFADRFSLILCRDEATRLLFNHIGKQADCLPCPSLWARDRLTIERIAPDDYVVVSYSEESSSWSAFTEDSRKTRGEKVASVISNLKLRGVRIVQLAHNKKDVAVQGRLSGEHGIEKPLRAGAPDFLRTMAKARAVITWRVHAAMASLSLGTPSLLFESDSRSSMVQALGGLVVDTYASNESIEAWLDRVLAVESAGPSAIVTDLKRKSLVSYREKLAAVLGQDVTEAMRQ